MATKTKTFDCVEMKNRIQAKRLAEYEAHKEEFDSYIDFVNARVKKSRLWKGLARKSEKESDSKAMRENREKFD